MGSKLSLRRRLATAARWPVGVSLTSWRYMWRTTPMSRRELVGDLVQDGPPPLPPGAETRELQGPSVGAGALFHRRYEARIRDARVSPIELMSHLQKDLNAFAPSEFASFQKVKGDEERIRPGDEYVVRMPGPWDGPVRVLEVTPTSFRLATLEGHLEAGQIEFRAEGRERMVFTIESWARSGDAFSDLLYDRARMAKEIQLHMWTSVLERAIDHSGGRRDGRLRIETRRVDAEWPAERLARSARRRRMLAALEHAEYNFDRRELDDPRGWRLDQRCRPLPSEPAGQPAERGSWEVARRLMRGYEFADPSIVRAYYDPDAPLEGRDMLLELRFVGLRFLVGTRITTVHDEVRTLGGREAKVWGWSYATLEGHVEEGEMAWEVRKWLDTGEIDFTIDARSRPARSANPLLRIGFRLFGRREQLRFYDATCERMERLTEAATGEGSVREVAEEVTLHGRAATSSHDELARNVEQP